jgi:hypothetical protein
VAAVVNISDIGAPILLLLSIFKTILFISNLFTTEEISCALSCVTVSALLPVTQGADANFLYL